MLKVILTVPARISKLRVFFSLGVIIPVVDVKIVGMDYTGPQARLSLARPTVQVGHGDKVGENPSKRISIFDRETEANAKIARWVSILVGFYFTI